LRGKRYNAEKQERGEVEDLLNRFEETMADESPLSMRAVLRSIVDHVDLFFGHEQNASALTASNCAA
jgi:hypothetical protein